MRILVTGGAGFIGSHLIERLIRRDADTVWVLDNCRIKSNSARFSAERVRYLEGDVRDPVAVRHAMAGCELVYHLAAQANVMGAEENPEYSFSTNVVGTFNVLHAAQRGGVGRVVFTSSREVYGDGDGGYVSESAPLRPKNLYGASKAAAEMYCRAFAAAGLNTTILRLANVYGPLDGQRVIPIFIENALKGNPLLLYGGGQLLDLVWIGMVVDALISAGYRAPVDGPINIGSGKGTPIVDLAQRILDMMGSRSKIRFMPARAAEVEKFVADTSRANHLFGLAPPADPLFGLPEVISWMRARGHPAEANLEPRYGRAAGSDCSLAHRVPQY